MKLDKYLYIYISIFFFVFFSQGLADELGKDGACDEAIFPDKNNVITRCGIMGNQSAVGVSSFQCSHTHPHCHDSSPRA